MPVPVPGRQPGGTSAVGVLGGAVSRTGPPIGSSTSVPSSRTVTTRMRPDGVGTDAVSAVADAAVPDPQDTDGRAVTTGSNTSVPSASTAISRCGPSGSISTVPRRARLPRCVPYAPAAAPRPRPRPAAKRYPSDVGIEVSTIARAVADSCRAAMPRVSRSCAASPVGPEMTPATPPRTAPQARDASASPKRAAMPRPSRLVAAPTPRVTSATRTARPAAPHRRSCAWWTSLAGLPAPGHLVGGLVESQAEQGAQRSRRRRSSPRRRRPGRPPRTRIHPRTSSPRRPPSTRPSPRRSAGRGSGRGHCPRATRRCSSASAIRTARASKSVPTALAPARLGRASPGTPCIR